MTKLYVFGIECFVQHPGVRGAWLRTHVCVAVVDCPVCGAKRGAPCHTDDEPLRALSVTHVRRRRAGENVRPETITVITGPQVLDETPPR